MASVALAKGPLWMQNVEYPAVWDRTFYDALLEEGFFAGGGVVTAAGGMDISVTPFRCAVAGDEVTGQGKYFVDSEATVVLTVASAGVDRTEYVYLAINDPSVVGGRAGNNATVESGAALPADSTLLIATISLLAGVVTITNGMITDGRVFTSLNLDVSGLVGGGDMLTTANLNDLTNTTTARTNLGLGTLAVVTPTGTPSGTTFLRGDNVWAAAGLAGTDGDVIAYQPLLYRNDERSTELTYTGDDLTQVLEKDGATTVKQTDLTYTAGKLTSVVELADSITVTTALTYTGDNLTSTTRTVT